MNTFKEFLKYILDKNVARHSQALSFATVLSIVPIITIFLGFIGSSDIFFNINNEVNIFLNSYLFPKAISSTFNQYFSVFSEQATHLKLIGIVFFILSILLLFSDMETSFSDLVDPPEDSDIKIIIHKKVITVFTLFFAPVILFLIIGIFNWITSLNFLKIGEIIKIFASHNFIIQIVLLVFLWLWFSLLFYILPRKKMKFKSLLIGSSVATFLFIISQKLFSFYISSFSSYQLIYGVFSIIPIFLLWIYLNWQITLYSLLFANFIDDNIKMEMNQDQA